MEQNTDRKLRLADAAVEVIDADGLRGLTHRAVESQAGLPPGTCSYHFPTRRALIAAILQRIADADRADIDNAIAGQAWAPDMDPAILIDAATATLATWLGPARARSRARLLLMLDRPSQQLAASTIDGVTAGFRAMATEVTGDADRADLVMALIDGLIVDELTTGTTPVDGTRLRDRMTVIVGLALPPPEPIRPPGIT
ncbi:TetR/AcrR family transcriptional regulator [Streptomyces sp. NPDC096176]|uniref:TetR/AcrR family transcriptional regulator n=1 Tax=Streptomyces sp. NPDC096176 TaxID=3366079 RepID=UPI00382B3021